MKKYLIGVFVGIAITALTAMVQTYQVKKSTAEVQSYENVLIFSDCKPVAEYEYLGTVKYNTGGFGGSQYEDIRDALLKKAKKEFPEAQGLILNLKKGQADKADVIKFK